VERRDFIKQAAAVGLTAAGGALWVRRSGDAQGALMPLRPPGALSEAAFTATCIRCMRCVDACPNHALVSLAEGTHGDAGTPTLHPRSSACMLCAHEDGEYLKCTEACPSGALQLTRRTREDIHANVSIGVAEIDQGLCYSYNNWSCGACYRACPLADEAMTVGMWEKPTVHPDQCVGCGCCERACIRYPHAIRVRAKVT